MHLDKLLNGYKLGRFLFAFSFFFSFVVYGKILENSQYNIPEVILFVYLITSFALIFYSKIYFLEFLLDIIFLSAFILFLMKLVPYLSILFLFPVFFYALLSGSKKSYILAFISFTLTIVFKLIAEKTSISNLFLISFLNGFSFFIITFAGIKLNEKLKKQQEYIKQLEEFKKESELYKRLYQISSNIAHEIKNPLASISASAQLIKQGNLNEKLINIIYEESKRIDNLLKDFLTLSKSFFGKEERVNIVEFINNLLKTCFIKKEIKLFYKDKNIHVKINPKALESILRNLVKNADFWGKSKIIISIDKVGNYVYLSVEDDGSGIDDNIKEHIFEPFFSTNPEGTGLGLAIAKSIAINYNGDIVVNRSDVLGGAKFTVILPVEDKDEGDNNR